MLIGASRKTFLGKLLAAADGSPRPAKERDDATVALNTVLALREVWGVRVHAVRANRDAVACRAAIALALDPDWPKWVLQGSDRVA